MVRLTGNAQFVRIEFHCLTTDVCVCARPAGFMDERACALDCVCCKGEGGGTG